MMQLAIVGSDKPFIWLVESRYRIGKGNTCDIKLADKTLEDVHLQLNVDGDKVTLVPAGGALVSVNDAPAIAGCEVKHGDRLKLGQTELQVSDPKIAARKPHPSHVSQSSNASSNDTQTWVLHGLSTALSNKRYHIAATQVVGRAQDCNICLAVAHLSRQHARLSLDEKGMLVEDLDSANGTFVNGKRVDKSRLKSGDELRFDTVRFRVLAPGADIDLDKTMLRPAMPSPTPKKSSRVAPSDASAAAHRQPHRAQTQASADTGSSEPPRSSFGGLWWVLGALLFLALGALWVLDAK